MEKTTRLPFITLLLMISFASVNAVLFTPALPSIAKFFAISDVTAQQTITWYLVGYTLGQLLYGPIANRFGRKPALYTGILIEIVSSLICAWAGYIDSYLMLVIGRFFLAIGSGVGLKMTFTLVNECYEPRKASQTISYLMLAFAITPGLAIALGGFLNSHYGWQSCFYASAIFGLVLLLLTMQLPETKKTLDFDALKAGHLLAAYRNQFTNKRLVSGGLLMGACSSFVYVFAALAPFIAINLYRMSSVDYGIANLLPPIGLLLGSLLSARLTTRYPLSVMIRTGIIISIVGVVLMSLGIWLQLPVVLFLFLPVIVIYFGLCFILANASSLALSQVEDKAHGSAVMSFINMGTATLFTLCLGLFGMSLLLMPLTFFGLCLVMTIMSRVLLKN